MHPRRTGTDIALIAAFAALIAVCALLPALKVGGPVPINLQRHQEAVRTALSCTNVLHL